MDKVDDPLGLKEIADDISRENNKEYVPRIFLSVDDECGSHKRKKKSFSPRKTKKKCRKFLRRKKQ